MSSATVTSGGPAATDRHGRAPERARRLAALLIDCAALVLMVLVAALAATLWLLVRTAWGRDDPASGDTVIASALVLAAPPAWLAWQLARVRRVAGTAGQARVALAVRRPDGSPASVRAATIRLACHPLAIAAWLWLAMLALMLGELWFAVAGVFAAGLWALAAALTAVLVLRDPAARALHDRVAGTSLWRR